MNIKTFIEDSEREAEMLIDSFCEPKVTKTNEHPNCEYVFTCEEMEAFENKLKSFTSQKLRELIGEVRTHLNGRIGFLRQWINEKDADVLVTNEGIMRWLELELLDEAGGKE